MDNLLRQKIGGRIRDLRKSKGWSQEKAANEIGCSWRAVQRWESGAVTPQWGSIEQVARAFGVSTSAIVGEEAPPGIVPDSPSTRLDKLTLEVAALQAKVDQLLKAHDDKGSPF